jgi:hypothetical protein
MTVKDKDVNDKINMNELTKVDWTVSSPNDNYGKPLLGIRLMNTLEKEGMD